MVIMSSPLSNITYRPLEETVPETGSPTGILGLVFVFTSIIELKERVTKAFKSKDLEVKMLAVHDIIKAPFKLCIGALSAISILSTAAKVLAIAIGVVMTPVALSICALVFTIASAIYLGMELIRSIIILKKSNAFLDKEEIGTVLKKIELLKTKEKNTLLSNCDMSALKQAQAILTYNKLNTLFSNYVSSDVDQKEYFARRIGNNAANAFSERVQNITQYNLPLLQTMDDTKLDTFIDQGKSLLKMVNTQALKVQKIHIFSLIVIFVAGLALAVSSQFIAISAPITCLSGAIALARSVGNDGYIDHAGEGINLRLCIPKCLSPTKKGEKVWSIWRTTDYKNPHTNRFLKCLYIFGCFLSVGILPLFDGAIFKAEWIKKARGDGENYNIPANETMRVPALKN